LRFVPVVLILGCVCAFATPGAAAPAPSDEALAAKLTLDAEIADQNRRSGALNNEVNRKNAAVEARNAAAKAAYDEAQAGFRNALTEHAAMVKAQEADAARAQADYQKAMAGGQAAVAACKAGDVSRCQTSTPGNGQPAS
jgi:hypothetical protein